MASSFGLSQFDFPLDESQLALHLARPRDAARLLVIRRQQLVDQHVRDLPRWLKRGDVLVVNTTKVFPARLLGKRSTGGKVELLLLHTTSNGDWVCVGKGVTEKTTIHFSSRLTAELPTRQEDDTWLVRFSLTGKQLWKEVERIGQTPLPPYLKNIPAGSQVRRAYQTLFAKQRGSAAAPTAGLHFTPALLTKLRRAGVVIVPVVLHVGWGTFAPIRHSDIRRHQMHAEWGEISAASRKKLLDVKRLQGQKSAPQIFAVGTTALRVVEAAARDSKHPSGRWSGWISLYLKPGDTLKMVDGLLTNFHLPKTSLFVLVCCLLGTQRAQTIYATARQRGYRWASFGDAMLILPEARSYSKVTKSTPV